MGITEICIFPMPSDYVCMYACMYIYIICMRAYTILQYLKHLWTIDNYKAIELIAWLIAVGYN